MIRKRDIPLYKSFGVFTEAPKGKRKPNIINVAPSKVDYTKYVDPLEEIDADIPNIDDELADYQFDFNDLNPEDMDMVDADAISEDDPDDNTVDADKIPDNPDVEDPELSEDEEKLLSDDNTIDADEANGDVVDVTNDEDDNVVNTDDVNEEDIVDATANTKTEIEPVSDTGEVADSNQEDGEVVDTDNTTPIEGDTVDADTQPSQDTDGDIVDADNGDTTNNISTDGEDVINAETPTDPSVDSTADQSGQIAQDPNAPQEITKDDMRKYELYRRFLGLYNTIIYFIEKLDLLVTDSDKFVTVSRKVNRIFKKIEEILRDYMLLKFQSDSYLQNSIFYEKIKAIVLLCVDMLDKNKITPEEDNASTKK